MAKHLLPHRNHKTLSTVLLASMLLPAAALTALSQERESNTRYDLESLHGDYAAVATYGAGVAQALGTQQMDGCGHVKGSALVNQPGSGGTRQISHITFSGTYTVNDDGTGSFLLTLDLPGGKTAKAVEDFVITKARGIDGVVIATQIVDAQEEPSHVIPGGVFVTHTYTRRSK